MSAAGAPIILDLTRLLSRVLHPTPTGVDRVEMAYARGLSALVPDRLRFAAVHPYLGYGRLPARAVGRFLDLVEARWREDGRAAARMLRREAAASLVALRPRRAGIGHEGGGIFLQPSPNNLTRPALVAEIMRRERARLVCMVHDLIPLDYPEYARPDGAALHARRIDTVVRLASGIVCNSQATLDALAPWIARAGTAPATAVALLGTETGGSAPPTGGHARDERPYFVCIGTIEPRKNHLLLLNLWRKMAEREGPAAVPRLLVIGRRGWENEQVVDMLERCPALRGCVEELSGLPDRAMRALTAGARALLLPSFAEGYGMPVAEAIAQGVPVVCSDLPALREAGGDVPDFLDPLDGPGWAAAIADLAGPASRLAAAQGVRRAGWHAPSWDGHLAILLRLLHRIAP